jgi:uncharacterized phage protein (TIGR02218 family)
MVASENLSLSTALNIELTRFQPKIIAITEADPAEVTTDVVHRYVTGDTVKFRDIQGMTNIEALIGIVTFVSPTVFTVDIDSSAFFSFLADAGTLNTNRAARITGYTDWDQQFTLDKISYEPAIGYSPSTIKSSSDLAVDNIELQGIIDSEGITDADLIAGVYDYSILTFFMFDNMNPTNGDIVTIKRGRTGEVSMERDLFRAEFRGLATNLTQDTIQQYTPSCIVELGSPKCGFDISTLEITGTVSDLTNRRKFEDTTLTDADGFFDSGKIRWLTGNNAGVEIEVREYLLTDPINPNIVLLDRMTADIQIGDTYSMTPGCNKSIAECRDVYENVINFRGFPHLPGLAEYLDYGNRTAD